MILYCCIVFGVHSSKVSRVMLVAGTVESCPRFPILDRRSQFFFSEVILKVSATRTVHVVRGSRAPLFCQCVPISHLPDRGTHLR